MLDNWYIRNTTEEAQRKSPLMTLIEQTPQDAFESMMNDESQPMNPILSMTSDEAQQQTAILSMMNDDEPLQQNSIMSALKELPAADLSSSVEDDSDEDESVVYVTDFKELYTELKKNLKMLIKENVYYKEILRTSQNRLLKITRDRSFLLDRLEKYQQVDRSSSDSDVTVDSDDSVRITKEELERHLQSRQTMPQVIPEGELPIEMFNNNSSTEPNDQLN
uniref:INO80 complex subunit E N-terminal domain-containing protein n=1 Tax=Anopheles minimus TaxID=112268 RepID=A0A182W4W0_9DIPT